MFVYFFSNVFKIQKKQKGFTRFTILQAEKHIVMDTDLHLQNEFVLFFQKIKECNLEQVCAKKRRGKEPSSSENRQKHIDNHNCGDDVTRHH